MELPRSQRGFATWSLRDKPRSGFSIVESILAIAILIGVALSSALIVVPVSRQVRINREFELANAEAHKFLEKVRSLPFNDIQSTFPPGTRRSISGLNLGWMTVAYPDPSPDPLRVDLTLSWDSPDLGTVIRTFRTVRTE